MRDPDRLIKLYDEGFYLNYLRARLQHVNYMLNKLNVPTPSSKYYPGKPFGHDERPGNHVSLLIVERKLIEEQLQLLNDGDTR